MIFLKDVIDGAYNNCEVSDINLIISELDYRDNIQKDIITPFIDSFNKEIYINNPISISDSNLFFHYLRVKFFHFLQNSFNGIEKKFVYFCEILYNKIVSMTSEKSPDLKKKLLLEILCMICIFGFHDDEKTDIIDFYNHNQKIPDLYYHPILFFLPSEEYFI